MLISPPALSPTILSLMKKKKKTREAGQKKKELLPMCQLVFFLSLGRIRIPQQDHKGGCLIPKRKRNCVIVVLRCFRFRSRPGESHKRESERERLIRADGLNFLSDK